MLSDDKKPVIVKVEVDLLTPTVVLLLLVFLGVSVLQDPGCVVNVNGKHYNVRVAKQRPAQ